MRAGAGLLRTKGGGEQCAAPGQGDFKLVHPTQPSLGQGGGDARSALGPAQLGHKSEITGSAFRCLVWVDFNNPVLTLYCTAQCTLALRRSPYLVAHLLPKHDVNSHLGKVATCKTLHFCTDYLQILQISEKICNGCRHYQRKSVAFMSVSMRRNRTRPSVLCRKLSFA